jgi:DNA polymerase phi
MKRAHPKSVVPSRQDDEDDSADMSVSPEEKGGDGNDWTDRDDQDEDDDGDEMMVDEDDEEEQAMNKRNIGTISNGTSSPFLDSFYGISVPSAADRARAAHTLIQHCLLDSTTANAKDAAYALKRLFNGLCSGRAAARQGNASALATFLKVAFHIPGRMTEIRAEYALNKSNAKKSNHAEPSEVTAVSDWAFIRDSLLSATEAPSSGASSGPRKAKGSEERDYQFGRLFGINAIVRSGILLFSRHTSQDTTTASLSQPRDEIRSVATLLVNDLIDLYGTKKWIREPAAHAICTLLASFCNSTGSASDASSESMQAIAHGLIQQVVIPQLLQKGDHAGRTHEHAKDATLKVLASFSAEQVAIALFIQNQNRSDLSSLPSPLNVPIVTKATLPILSLALSETSSVTYPRTHLVWDTLLLYITESTKSSTHVDRRQDRRSSGGLNDGESVHDLLGGVLQHVVIERLLGMDLTSTTDETSGSKTAASKTTHERRALVLCLVRNLLGIEFISSLSGRTQIHLDPELLERVVLNPILVRRLFLDVICAGTTNKSKQQGSHVLKPLALQILVQCVESRSMMADDLNRDDVLDHFRARLSISRALLRCEIRFDSKTKTSVVETLLGLGLQAEISPEMLNLLWEPYGNFLMERIAVVGHSDTTIATTTLEGQGYVELLFQFGKRLVRLETDLEDSILTFKSTALQRILAFLMATAFFDCHACVDKTAPKKKKKEKKEKKRSTVAQHDVVALDVALMIKNSRTAATALCPYDTRVVASARFFSLVADSVSTMLHSSNTNKEGQVQDLLFNLSEMQSTMMGAGAKKLSSSSASRDEMESDGDEDAESIVKRLQNEARDNGKNENDNRKRWLSSCSMLANTLHLHQLTCGTPDSETGHGDPDADDEEDVEQVRELLSDLSYVSSLYSKECSEEEDALLALAEMCTCVLSSPLGVGNQSRGASPTLLREVVRFAWTGGLNMSAHGSKPSLSTKVVNVLLNAIGAMDESNIEDGADAESNEDDESSDGESDLDLDRGSSKANGTIEVVDKDSDDEDQDSDNDVQSGRGHHGDDEDGEELELDPSKLQSMLEEGSDAEISEGELEHHEGADAALAKLIQLKQDARKAGQVARERTEIARQIRCIALLETLVVGKPDTWGPLLCVDSTLSMIIPILQYRKELVRSLTRAAEKGSSLGEKRALLDRLTGLLKTKILKAKVPEKMWNETKAEQDELRDLAATLFRIAAESEEKEQQSLCNNAVLFLCRTIPDPTTKLKVADLYSEAVLDWSTKRTRLDATMFDGLIHHNPVLAQACLGSALATAALNGRTTFLKSESFRLLSLLYNTKLNPNATELETVAMERIVKASELVFAAVTGSLKDADMKKTKRVREVLKSAQKVVLFLARPSQSLPVQSRKHLVEMKELLAQLQADSASKGIANSSDALSSAIDDLLSNEDILGVSDGEPVDRDEEMDGEIGGKSESVEPEGRDSKAKKKLKKSKKKKK